MGCSTKHNPWQHNAFQFGSGTDAKQPIWNESTDIEPEHYFAGYIGDEHSEFAEYGNSEFGSPEPNFAVRYYALADHSGRRFHSDNRKLYKCCSRGR